MKRARLAEIPDPEKHERALLVGVTLPGMSGWATDDSLDELGRLADTAMLTESGRMLQSRRRIDPAYYIGRGKVEELRAMAHEQGAEVIVFDNDLSPAQMRNLEKLTEIRIIDRSAVILDIFSRHARSRTAQLQVELAQLNYLLPRLTGQWTHLSRQAGGGAIRGMGGAGVRGPGETQLEVDRRMIRRSIGTLSAKLARIGTQRATARQQRHDTFKVALVGYTNAGKSTLMRALSGANVLVQDRLFATLDSTTRAVDIGHKQQILLTDTVGFIKRLPHNLFASFRSTIEDALDADLLLHVVDASHPQRQDHVETVNKVLFELGLADRTAIIVNNKIDRIKPRTESSTADASGEEVFPVSAVGGIGLNALRQRICHLSQENSVILELQIPQSEGKLLAQLQRKAELLHTSYVGNTVRMRVRLDCVLAKRWNLDRFSIAAVSH